MIKPPKFVKRANQWVVTIVKQDKDKTIQNQHWFSTEKEAIEFHNQEIEGQEQDVIKGGYRFITPTPPPNPAPAGSWGTAVP